MLAPPSGPRNASRVLECQAVLLERGTIKGAEGADAFPLFHGETLSLAGRTLEPPAGRRSQQHTPKSQPAAPHTAHWREVQPGGLSFPGLCSGHTKSTHTSPCTHAHMHTHTLADIQMHTTHVPTHAHAQTHMHMLTKHTYTCTHICTQHTPIFRVLTQIIPVET